MTDLSDNPAYRRFADLIQQNTERRRVRLERNGRVRMAAARGDWKQLTDIINEPIDEWLSRIGGGQGDATPSGGGEIAGDGGS